MATKSGTWRIWFSDVLIAIGALILLLGALLSTRTVLAAGQVKEYHYLPSPLQPALPLPVLYHDGEIVKPNLSSGPESPANPAAAAPVQPQASPAGLQAAAPAATAVPAVSPPAQAAVQPAAAGLPTPTAAPVKPTVDVSALALPTSLAPTAVPPTAIPPTETPQPTPTFTPVPTEGIPAYSPVVRLVIPALDIDRAVVPVGLKPASGGSLEWDTDPLFASRNRPDLVGQLIGSYSPGQGGNILLIGHNYNQVDWGWTGVFVDIKNLAAGDQIFVFTEDGRKTAYQVVQVKQVPWRSKNANELEKHMKFMGPSEGERLTLITCGGANIWPFPARVYVVSEPLAP